jgi:putative addiction module component (TIGR02574 family)
MSLPLDRVRAEAMDLSAAERAQLARGLIASLDVDVYEDPAEVEAAWADEIRRRLSEYRSGAVEAIPAEDVFAEARALLR